MRQVAIQSTSIRHFGSKPTLTITPFVPSLIYMLNLVSNRVLNVKFSSLYRYVSDQNLWTKHKIQHLRLPTVDFSNPQIENLFHGVEFLRTVRQENKTAYIHCKAGRQRSANLAACYLIDTYGMTPDEAARRIRSIRPSTIFGTREMKRLSEFVEYLRDEYHKKQQAIKSSI